MQQYLDLMQYVRDNGIEKEDRTGTGTRSVFGSQLRFNLQEGFPLITTKQIHLKSVIYELLWFLSGETNIKFLKDNGVTIWNEWADRNGELGPVYGYQWRKQNSEQVDQLQNILWQIKTSPNSRRMVLSAWNFDDLPRMALPPCHYSCQFYVAHGQLSCLFNMRSVDVFLGLPFNIASYAFLTHMMAQQAGLKVGELIFSGGDVHLYRNHLDQAALQLSRKPYPLPQLEFKRKPEDLYSYHYEDFVILNYKHYPKIPAPIAV